MKCNLSEKKNYQFQAIRVTEAGRPVIGIKLADNELILVSSRTYAPVITMYMSLFFFF